MRDAEKNRDPERAQKRARADARCALRKLDLLDMILGWEDWYERARNGGASREGELTEDSMMRVGSEAEELASKIRDALR